MSIQSAAPHGDPLARAPWDADEDGIRVTGVTTFVTAPANIPLLIVRVDTSEDGLVGWGCASSPQRPLAIRAVIDRYLGPLLTGRLVGDIEDFHHLAELSPYWRGGAIENNALAGIDLALWDIKGKLAGMPVHQLLGGRARARIPVYGHANGLDHDEVADEVRGFMEAGYEYVRCQIAVADADTYGVHSSDDRDLAERKHRRAIPWRPRAYAHAVPKMFDAVREAVGFDVELLHDVHERLSPVQAIRLARNLEPHRLFFLEDALAPEDLEWYRNMREQTVTPQAVGEVFSDVQTFLPLVSDRLIDFARIRMGALGGITPTVKLAHFCELYGVRLAIHGPGDISPIGHASGLAVDASSRAFGIQESIHYADALHEVFPGAPVLMDGAYEISAEPGLGVEFDARAAARYPVPEPLTFDSWALLRQDDGAVARP